MQVVGIARRAEAESFPRPVEQKTMESQGRCVTHLNRGFRDLESKCVDSFVVIEIRIA